MESTKNVSQINKEGKLFTITALISVAELESEEIALNPNLLTYDIYAKVSLKEDEEIQNTEKRTDFVTEYKALCGHLLNKKYKYEDYIKGGMSLLTRDELLKRIYEAQTKEDIVDILSEEYDKTYREEKEIKQSVSRKKYKALKISVIAVAVMLLLSIAYITYDYLYQTRIDKAYIAGHEAYLEKNYPQCIEALSKVQIKDLDKDTKQIIAVSVVKTDNLTQEQKDNITLDITTTNAEIVYEYWIKLSRGMYEDAQVTAMQLSDDEMLLYAYMKEAVYLKNDTKIDGEIKAQRLENIEGQIEKLSQQYDPEK